MYLRDYIVKLGNRINNNDISLNTGMKKYTEINNILLQLLSKNNVTSYNKLYTLIGDQHGGVSDINQLSDDIKALYTEGKKKILPGDLPGYESKKKKVDDELARIQNDINDINHEYVEYDKQSKKLFSQLQDISILIKNFLTVT